MEFRQIVKMAKEKGSSDIHIVEGDVPKVRIDGDLIKLEGFSELSKTDVEGIYEELGIKTPDGYVEQFKTTLNYDASIGFEDVRLRIHGYKTMGRLAGVFRLIEQEIPYLGDLNLPPVVEELIDTPSGLGIVTGITGSGKTTTLAALINEINKKYRKKIITIEDPVEYVYQNIKADICQRELGKDVYTFSDGVRAAMREDPDIVLVGELRDLETIEAALTLAETGHLVIGTTHTRSTASSFSRMVAEFSGDMQDKARYMLASNISFVIGQKLMKKVGGGRVPISEVLIPDDSIRSNIRENKPATVIDSTIHANSQQLGSLLFTQSASHFYKKGWIDEAHLPEYFTDDQIEAIIHGTFKFSNYIGAGGKYKEEEGNGSKKKNKLDL